MTATQVFILMVGVSIVMHLILSIQVIKARRNRNTQNSSSEKVFNAKVRAHANYLEYTPIFLISLLGLTLIKQSFISLLILGGVFIVGRIIHALGLIIFEQRSPANYLPRVIGMTLTLVPLGIAAIILIAYPFI
jgi:hypothetical protein